MTADDWSLVKQVFEGALNQQPEARSAWLDLACVGHPEARSEVESLLAAEELAGGFLQEPVIAHVSGLPVIADPKLVSPSWIGRRIGPYRLTAEIGHGGMGTVFLAERDDDQFRKQVAIKIANPGAYSPEMLRHFIAERQILATLEYPNIARLLDGGITEDGLPYMAMEYVDGIAITEHCTKEGLTVRRRLELFETVCRAVHYAHQHLVVHRDLKPGNILVTPDGVPFLLDFGIAKILDPLTPSGATTGFFRPMTVEYASPEQLRGAPPTTATDIYSLGVILYELLSGHPPFQLASVPLDQAIRTVSEAEPPKPSARARLRYSEDLDFIVLKAIRKEPGQRYASALEFAADIRRYLESNPVLARRGSTRYVLRKLVERHKVAFAASATGLALAIAGVGAVGWEAHVARQQRARAQHRFDELRGLAHSVIFEMHDDIAQLPGSTEVRKRLVTRAIDYLDSLAKDAAGDPGLQAELAAGYLRLGEVQGSPKSANLGDSQAAMTSYRKALQLAQDAANRKLGSESNVQQIGLIYVSIGELEIFRREPSDARRNLEQAIRILQPPAEQPGAGATVQAAFAGALLDMYILLRETDLSKAMEYLNRTTVVYERRLSQAPEDDGARNNVALVHRYLAAEQRDSQTALVHLRRSLDLDERRAAANPTLATPRLDLSTDLSEMGHRLRGSKRFAEALPLYQRSLVIREQLAAADPKNVFMQSRVGFAHLAVATALLGLDQNAAALESLRKTIAIYSDYSIRNPSDVLVHNWLVQSHTEAGKAEAKLGHPAAACDDFRKARDLIPTLTGRAGKDTVTWAEPFINQGLAACRD